MRKQANKVRIIAGRFRGRQITFGDHDGLRPTGDRLRETLFSWLQMHLPGSRCLDMFAGSGVLGFEALSRGAETVVLFEKSPQVESVIRTNAASLGINEATIVRADVLHDGVLCSVCGPASVDIVFIDPPFAAGIQQSVVTLLDNSGVLAAGAAIVIESDKRQAIVSVPDHWELAREKVAGEVRLQLYRLVE